MLNVIMLRVAMLNVIMLSVIMLNVVMLIVVAPENRCSKNWSFLSSFFVVALMFEGAKYHKVIHSLL